MTSSASQEARGLPRGWRRARLGDLIREAQPGFASGKRDLRGVVQLRMNNVNSSGRLDWSALTRVPVDAAIVDAFGLRPGDVLFNNTNSAELVGKSALFEGFDEPVVFSNHFTRLRTDETQLAPDFLAAWFQDKWNSGLFREICHRWVGQAAVQRDRLLALEIVLPDIHEQRRVAAAVRSQVAEVERARAAAKARLEAATALKVAHLRRIFSTSEARAWPVRLLGEVCERITDGTHQPPPFTRDGVPFLFVRNIVGGKIDFNVEKHVSFDTYERLVERCRPERGDILYSAVGSYGVAVVVDTDRPFTFQRHIAHIKPRRDFVDSDFVASYLNSPEGRRQSNLAALGGAQRTVSLTLLANFRVPTPNLSEQARIKTSLAEKARETQRLIARLNEELAAINQLPAELLRRAFSGEA